MKNRNQIILETIVQILEAEGETPQPREIPKYITKEGKKIINPEWVEKEFPGGVQRMKGTQGDIDYKMGGIG